MTIDDIRSASLVELGEMIKQADNKKLLNTIIYEIVCRIYVPFSGISFDDLLLMHGYQIENKEDKNFKL